MIKKKLISMLVSVTMLVGMFPMMMVSADEEPGSFTELQALIDQQGMPYLQKDYEWKEGDSSLHWSSDQHFGGLVLDGCTIDAKGHGPIIEVGEGEEFQIAGNGTITGGCAENGGAVYVANGGTFTLSGSQITGCTATENGGAIYNEGTIVIENSPVIANNSAAGNGGGIYQAPGASITVAGSPVITGNTANDLYLTEGQVVTCRSLSGGTIFVDSEVSAAITSGFTGSSAEPFYADDGCTLSLQNDGQVYLEKSGSGPVVNDPEFAGLSLTLDDGKFGLNIFVDPGTLTSEDLASSQVTFTVPGRGANVQTDTFDPSCTATKDGKTVYGYTCHLSSVQMAEKISMTFSAGETSLTCEYSVADYISMYKENTASLGLPENHYRDDLVNRVSDYGYFIQPYLSAENGWSYGEEGGYARMENIYGTSSYSQAVIDTIMNECSNYQAVKNKVGDSIKGISMRLELDSSNAAIVTFTMADETAKLAVTCDYAGTTYKAYKKADGKYVIRIPGIPIQDMEQPLTISGTSGDGEEVNITIKPIGYIYYALNNLNSNEQKKNAMVSLYFYWYYAERYVG